MNPRSNHRKHAHHPSLFPALLEKELGVELFRRTKRQLENRIGIGFVVSPLNDKRLEIEVILHEPLILALPESHPLAMRSEVRVQELANEPFITFQRDRGCGLYDMLIAVCLSAGFSPRVIQEADEMQVMLGFVAAGLGIAMLSASDFSR